MRLTPCSRWLSSNRRCARYRAQRSVPAVLYALDASTGKELWNSGKAIASFSHSGGLAVGGSKVFVSTPITSDKAGNIYFGYEVSGSAPGGLTSGMGRP